MNITISARAFFISLLTAALLISVSMNIFLIAQISQNQQLYQLRQANAKIMDFRNMFTQKVLLSNKEIDFDTRLDLETAVRSLNDEEIFAEWQRFTKSTTKEEATAEAKNLLSLLIRKTSN